MKKYFALLLPFESFLFLALWALEKTRELTLLPRLRRAGL